MGTKKICFISYAHDTTENNKWVERLAKKIKSSGIEVRLDALDTLPGDDIFKYMIDAYNESDRTIVICTEKYYNKFSGGAGFEKMLMGAHLTKDAFSNKFIPILRGNDSSNCIPPFLQTKVYIEMNGLRIKTSDVDTIIKTINSRKSTAKSSINKKTSIKKKIP